MKTGRGTYEGGRENKIKGSSKKMKETERDVTQNCISLLNMKEVCKKIHIYRKQRRL